MVAADAVVDGDGGGEAAVSGIGVGLLRQAAGAVGVEDGVGAAIAPRHGDLPGLVRAGIGEGAEGKGLARTLACRLVGWCADHGRDVVDGDGCHTGGGETAGVGDEQAHAEGAACRVGAVLAGGLGGGEVKDAIVGAVPGIGDEAVFSGGGAAVEGDGGRFFAAVGAAGVRRGQDGLAVELVGAHVHDVGAVVGDGGDVEFPRAGRRGRWRGRWRRHRRRRWRGSPGAGAGCPRGVHEARVGVEIAAAVVHAAVWLAMPLPWTPPWIRLVLRVGVAESLYT